MAQQGRKGKQASAGNPSAFQPISKVVVELLQRASFHVMIQDEMRRKSKKKEQVSVSNLLAEVGSHDGNARRRYAFYTN